ncbi:hypothetical protein [Microbispora sp. GKU 823]|uniref:hypothetical protein n=1 Tax=Microbispora sp. GKU 823 TaxID=1652100 RepID=UPI0009A2C682|nr:hypothetical protein [Microbispora sp. GKU 823]OPG11320.1 hypothetical protein B1L11_20770 [Microbispora sp. GKU 823]
MRDLPGFDAFTADQAQPLARTALALTGDPKAARALVTTALTTVAARWSTVRWSFPAHAAREALYAAYLKRPRARGAARGDGHLTPGTDAAALAEALTGLTPRRRALLVACFHDGHTTWQAAGLCRMDARTANTETVLAVAELRNRLPASFVAATSPESPAGASSESTAGTVPDETSSGSGADGSSPASEGSVPEGMPPETARRRAAPDDDDADTGGATRGAPPAPSVTSWASPSHASGPSPTSWASPSQASGPSSTPWTSPWQPGHAAVPVSYAALPETALPETALTETALTESALPETGPAEAAFPETRPLAAPFAPPAAPASPPGSSGPDHRGDGPWEAALRRELAVLSAGMPALDPRPARRRGRAGRPAARHATPRPGHHHERHAPPPWSSYPSPSARRACSGAPGRARTAPPPACSTRAPRRPRSRPPCRPRTLRLPRVLHGRRL